MKRWIAGLLVLLLTVGMAPLSAGALDAPAHDHTGWTAVTQDGGLPSTAGSYYLTADIELKTAWNVPDGEVTLCLNGHHITLKDVAIENATTGQVEVTSRGAILVGAGSRLTLCECDTTLRHYAINEKNLGVVGSGSGSFTGGYITGRWTEVTDGYGSIGHGLTPAEGGLAVNLDGCAAVVGAGGELVIDGANFIGNTAMVGAGVLAMGTGAKVTLKRGTIGGNTATQTGAGVAVVNGADFTMEGGVIEKNSFAVVGEPSPLDVAAQFYGAGVSVFSFGAAESTRPASFTLVDGSIRSNTAGMMAGGVMVGPQDSFIMKGGSILYNKVGEEGLGPLIAAVETADDDEDEDDPVVYQPVAAGGGVAALGKFTMLGGTIRENQADLGGGVSLAGSPLVHLFQGGNGTAAVSRGAILDNRADFGKDVMVGGGLPSRLFPRLSEVEELPEFIPVGSGHLKVSGSPVLEDVYLGPAALSLDAAVIQDGGLTAGARIGVTAGKAPTAEAPVLAAKPVENGTPCQAEYYQSSQGYTVYEEDGNVYLGPKPATPVYYPTGYSVRAEQSAHGRTSADRSRAQAGETVTVTAAPEEGYLPEEITVADSAGNPVETAVAGEGRYTFLMPAADVTVTVTYADQAAVRARECDREECPLKEFTDVNLKGWYHDALHFALLRKLMAGLGDGLFAPNGVSTRAMAVTVLWRLAGSPTVNAPMMFTDVPEERWFTEAIRWGGAEGVISGYKDTTRFGPNDLLTRQDMAVILYYYYRTQLDGEEMGDLELPYADAGTVSGYALPAVRWATREGLLAGKNDGTLDPRAPITRAEVAQLLMKFYPLMQG